MLHLPPLKIFMPGAGGGYIIEGSGLFTDSAGEIYDAATPAGDSNNVFTVEAWVKLSESATENVIISWCRSGTARDFVSLIVQTDGSVRWIGQTTSDASSFQKITNALLRDYSGWYHIAATCDAPNTYANIWINGIDMSGAGYGYSTSTNPGVSDVFRVGTSGSRMRIGSRADAATTSELDGYLAQVSYRDGTAIADTSDYLETTADGYVIPLDTSGLDYGAAGIRLWGATDIAAGTDSSGNGITFDTVSGIVATNDSPTNDAANGYGNYCTGNPNDTTGWTWSAGNLTVTGSTADRVAATTIAVDVEDVDGWGCEFEFDAIGSAGSFTLGISTTPSPSRSSPNDTGYKWIIDNGNKKSGVGSSTYAGSLSAGDKVHAVVKGGALYFKKVGTGWADGSGGWTTGDFASATAAHTGLTGDVLFAVGNFAAAAMTGIFNFGQTSLTEALPTGVKQIATQNMPAPSVPDPSTEYFIDTVSHTNGATTQVDLPFDPATAGAAIRIKRTDSTGSWYCLDTKRGDTAYFQWESTADESDFSDGGFGTNKFDLSSDLATGTYLVECWKIGEQFDVQLKTGTGAAQTISHDGSFIAGAILGRVRNNTTNVARGYHRVLGAGTWEAANAPGAHTTSATAWNNTTPTAGSFQIGTDLSVSTKLTVLWIWKHGDVYSFDKYTGNGSTDGPSINTGNGSPTAFVFRRTDTSYQYTHMDIIRAETYNYINNQFYLTLTNADPAGTYNWQITATGMKCANSEGGNNASGVLHLTWAYGIRPIQGPGNQNQGRAR